MISIKYLLLFLTALMVCSPLKAKDDDHGMRSFSLGIGTLNRFAGDIQIDDQGGTESFDIHPFINLGFIYDFNSSFALYSEFIIATPRKGRDKKISTNQYYLLSSGLWRFSKHFNFQLGLGWSFYRISSDGGVQTLRNGPDETDFYMPEESSTAINFLVSTAFEYHWKVSQHPLSAKIQAMIYNSFESESRAYAYTLSFHYHFESHHW